MLLLGDAVERGALLALAAGAQKHDLVARQVAELVLVVMLEALRQVAGLARDLDHAVERTARDDQVTPGGARRLTHHLDARDVGGERGDRDAVLGVFDDLGDRFRHVALGRRVALAKRIGGIDDERIDAFVAELGKAALVERLADDGRGVELPVAGVKDEAERGADRQRAHLGDRVRERDHLDVERPDLEAAVQRNDVDRQLQLAAVLRELGAQHARGERRGIDRRLDAAATARSPRRRGPRVRA